MALADSVAARLRDDKLKCTVVQIQVKTPDFRTVQRQTTLKRATWLRQELIESAMSLIKIAHGYGSAIRSITITASGLVAADETEEQLDIFSDEAPTERQEGVESTLYELRRRFGQDSIRLGCYENEDIGIKKRRKP